MTWSEQETPAGADDDHGHPDAPVEPTGNPRVDAATARLAELDERPTEEHADVYEDVHRRLHEALADLDDED